MAPFQISRIVLPFLAATIPSLVMADIFKCDGQWTNKPCNGVVQREILEVVSSDADLEKPDADLIPKATEKAKETGESAAVTPKLEPLAPRYDIVRKLRKFNEELKKSRLITLSGDEFEGVQKFCLDRSHTFLDCQKLYNETKAGVEAKNRPKE